VREQLRVQRRGAPAHLEAAGQHALGAAAACHAVLHHLPDAQQAGVDLGVVAPVALVQAHHAGDRGAQRACQRQQLGAAAERVRQHRGVGRDDALALAVGGDLIADDEAAADRVVGAAVELAAVGVEGQAAHPIGVEGQRAAQHRQIVALDEGHRMAAGQHDAPLGAHRRQQRRHRVDVDRLRIMPGQAEQHRLVRAVAAPGGAQRAVQLDAHPRHRLEPALGDQALDEEPCGAHRPHGVRARRPDADLEQVEYADGHLVCLLECLGGGVRAPRSAPVGG
jgi:hypothetical protein